MLHRVGRRLPPGGLRDAGPAAPRRQITTLEGLPAPESERWVTALVATGGSQCGFCTPGIVMRLAALGLGPAPGGPASDRPAPVSGEQVDRALLAHLCRCTGWQTIEEAADLVSRRSTGSGRGGTSAAT